MPNFPVTEFIPPFWQHWTSILHYGILLGTLVMLSLSGDKSSMAFTLMLGALALVTGADLYLNLLNIPRIFVFLLRVAIFTIPVIVAGMAPTEETRAVGIVMGMLALPLLALTFLTCYFNPSVFVDPRILTWCG